MASRSLSLLIASGARASEQEALPLPRRGSHALGRAEPPLRIEVHLFVRAPVACRFVSAQRVSVSLPLSLPAVPIVVAAVVVRWAAEATCGWNASRERQQQ